MGTWIIQELRRIWKEKDGKAMGWDEIVALAKKARPFFAFIDPDNNAFYNPRNMEEAIKTFCRRSLQAIPRKRGEILRVAYEGLALKYAVVNEIIERLTGKKNKIVHVVGGGSKNTLLNQFTADSTGLVVLAGPEEATAIGNIMVQAKTCGLVSSIKEGRKLIRASFPMKEYTPQNDSIWREAVIKFKRLLEGKNHV
jgi:sugar (pentulose or hexulose) kinase